MAKLEKEVKKYVKSYMNCDLPLWKAIVPNGSGGQIRRQGFRSEADAIEFAAKKYLEVLSSRKGLKTFSSTLLFEEYWKQWLDVKVKDSLSTASAMRYEQTLTQKISPFFGSLKVSNIEKHHLRSFISDLQNKKEKSSVVNFSVRLFKAVMKQAQIDDLAPSSGINLMPSPKHKNKKPKFWDSKQINYFLNATTDYEMHDLWKLTLFTGLRAGEISGLKWDAVHLDSKVGLGAIEVVRSFNQKTRSMQETTKNGDRRIVPILPEAKEVLQRLYLTRDGEFVFGGKEPLDSSHFNRQLRTALNRLPREQVPIIPFHSLRHSFCSYLDSTGMNRRIVSEIMGHRDLNTTNRYSHINNQMMGNEFHRWLQSQNQQKTNKLEIVNL
jgi:integrase